MISDFNTELGEATQPLIAATQRLIALRKVQRNIIATIECMASTLPIIHLYCKAQAQLNSKRCALLPSSHRPLLPRHKDAMATFQ
jgi:hypothetical protein